MRRAVLMATLFVLCAGPALAADVARMPDVYVEGAPTSHQNQMGRGDALVASILQATFTDMGPAYVTALGNAGLSADLIYDPMGAWPDMGGYCLVLVTTSDMWWTYSYWPQEDAVLDAYMTAGGTCIVVGQDYLYTRTMGINGFPTDWLGVAGANQDLNFGDPEVWWNGTPGGPLEGMSGYVLACFEANPFFTDEIIPAMTGMITWTSAQVPFGVEGGSSTPVSCFSTVEFACQAQGELDEIIAELVAWLGPPSPTQKTSWGRVKGAFRE